MQKLFYSWILAVLSLSLSGVQSAKAGNFFSQDKDRQMRDAVILAFEKSHLTCFSSDSKKVKIKQIAELLSLTNQVFLPVIDNPQDLEDNPASLVFVGRAKPRERRRIFTVIPSTDYKEILSLSYRLQELKKINTGTLVEPTFSTEWVTLTQVECQ